MEPYRWHSLESTVNRNRAHSKAVKAVQKVTRVSRAKPIRNFAALEEKVAISTL